MNSTDFISRFRRVICDARFNEEVLVAKKKVGDQLIDNLLISIKRHLRVNADTCGTLPGFNIRSYKTRAMPNGYYVIVHLLINGHEVRLVRFLLKKNSSY